jgi:MFS-type transporter involved in bile tolerance (Atg22 family)
VLRKKRKELKRKVACFFGLFLLSEFVFYTSPTLLSVLLLSLSATVEDEYCAFCSVLVFGVLLLCARKEIDTERQREKQRQRMPEKRSTDGEPKETKKIDPAASE